MYETLQLLRTIPSPSKRTEIHPPWTMRPLSLLGYSTRNKMSLLYLEALKVTHLPSVLEPIYESEQARYKKTLDAIARVSNSLGAKGIDHATFKTVRPYKSATVDIDVLVFGSRDNYNKATKVMEDNGCKLVVHGPRSTTLWDADAEIGIDLYEQVAVSFMSYMDIAKLLNYVTSTKLENGEKVRTLQPEADLACIIAHSVIKEQMYTLSEYYTFIHYLKQMSIKDFVQIVEENNIGSTVRTHASITALLHKTAHKSIPSELQQILRKLGQDNFETTRIIRRDFETPHKYHPITVARSLLEIAKGTKSRNSMAMQIYQMTHPSFASKFLKALMEHMLRETY